MTVGDRGITTSNPGPVNTGMKDSQIDSADLSITLVPAAAQLTSISGGTFVELVLQAARRWPRRGAASTRNRVG